MEQTLPRLLTALIFSACLNSAFAQDTKTLTLSAPPKNIAIDGDTREWGDSLHYYNTEKHINYDIANTKDTLYIAIRVNDRLSQMRILRAGLTFSIDTKGKKKETFSITFPLNVGGGKTPMDKLHTDDAPTDITKQDRDELMRERLTSLRGIKVTGFKDVEDEMITTSNTYGFQTAVNYDQNGYLVCEAAIPLSFFHADNLTANEWAFNFKINGVERQLKAEGSEEGESGHGGHGAEGGGMGGGGGGGHRGGRGGGSHSQAAGSGESNEMGKSEDFWVKYYLAK
jgi:YD repeat-containing protein